MLAIPLKKMSATVTASDLDDSVVSFNAWTNSSLVMRSVLLVISLRGEELYGWIVKRITAAARCSQGITRPIGLHGAYNADADFYTCDLKVVKTSSNRPNSIIGFLSSGLNRTVLYWRADSSSKVAHQDVVYVSHNIYIDMHI